MRLPPETEVQLTLESGLVIVGFPDANARFSIAGVPHGVHTLNVYTSKFVFPTVRPCDTLCLWAASCGPQIAALEQHAAWRGEPLIEQPGPAASKERMHPLPGACSLLVLPSCFEQAPVCFALQVKVAAGAGLDPPVSASLPEMPGVRATSSQGAYPSLPARALALRPRLHLSIAPCGMLRRPVQLSWHGPTCR